MKKCFYLLLILLLSLGCENDAKLTFEPLAITGESCDACPEIEISIPKAIDEIAVARAVNGALEEEIIALLSFDEMEDIAKIEDAISSFHNSYKALKAKFPEETIGWEAKIDADVIYEDDIILTLVLNAYTFTGGAHGYGSTTFLNFDKLKGIELENWELFDDLEGFQSFTETKFRIQEDIPQDKNINATGFMFERDAFHLAENIGYTKDGVQLVYNQYEVASYADGPIVLTIPFNEINKYLKRKVKF